MDIRLFTTGVILTNTYCFLVGERDFCFLDPGGNVDELLDYVKTQDGIISSVLLTHGHFDHIAGLRGLKEAFPHLKVYIHKDEAHRLGEDSFNIAYSEFVRLGISGIVSKEDFPTPAADVIFDDGDVILKDSLSFPAGLQVVSVPGHSDGSVCFLSLEHNLMFTGDTIFAQGNCGRTDGDGGDTNKLKASLEKILSFPDSVEIFPGHGPASILETEKKFWKGSLNF